MYLGDEYSVALYKGLITCHALKCITYLSVTLFGCFRIPARDLGR